MMGYAFQKELESREKEKAGHLKEMASTVTSALRELREEFGWLFTTEEERTKRERRVETTVESMRAVEAMTLENAPWDVKDMPAEAAQAWLETFNTRWKELKELDDKPRAMQAMSDADKAIRKAGWVFVAGGWMLEGDDPKVKEAQWTTKFINDLPDSAFAVIESGGAKDSQGKTVPRSLRHLPHHGPGGSVDSAHLRNALQRLPQTNISAALKAKARTHLEGHGSTKKESGIDRSESLSMPISLTEVSVDAEKNEAIVTLIEAGANVEKKRYYPKATVEKAAADFAGLKMFRNHATAKEESERPERDVTEWASTVLESWPEDGKARARIHAHHPWLIEVLNDPVARQNVGLSINTKGRSHMGEIHGQQMQIIDEIIVERSAHFMSSVDWVTEPGARGRVVELLESRRVDIMDLQTLTMTDLHQQRPDLVEGLRAAFLQEQRPKIEQEVKEQMGNDLKGVVTEAVQEAVKPLAQRLTSIENGSVIDRMLSGSKLPAKAQTQIREGLVSQAFESEEKLVEAVNAAVATQVEILKEGGVKIEDTPGASGNESGGEAEGVKESTQKEMDSLLLSQPEKKEDDE